MNVIQRRSSSMFSLSLPHFLSLSLSSRFLALPLSRSRSFFPSFSPSLSLSLSLSRFLSFFSIFHTYTFFRTHSVSMSLSACSRVFTTRICACAPSRHTSAHARTSTEHAFEWTILRA